MNYRKLIVLLFASFLTACDDDDNQVVDSCEGLSDYNPAYNIVGLTLDNGQRKQGDEVLGLRYFFSKQSL